MSMSGATGRRRGLLRDVLTFERLQTGPVIHLIYWCGLCLILLFGFGAVGASVGVALRELSLEGLLIAVPALVAGLLVMVALVLIWRGICEFYVAVFRIADDLHALRGFAQRERQEAAAASATAASSAGTATSSGAAAARGARHALFDSGHEA